MTEKYQYERKLRDELDRNKRRLELDMGEQKTQEQEKHNKMESMSQEMAKLEAELTKLRNKYDEQQKAKTQCFFLFYLFIHFSLEFV